MKIYGFIACFILVMIAAYAMSSCTGGKLTPVDKPASETPKGWTAPLDLDRSENSAGFRIYTMDERGKARPDLLDNYELEIVENGDRTSVNVNAVNFEDADWAFFYLYYDPGLYKPSFVEFSEFLGAPGEVLSISITDYWEHVAIGMCRVHFNKKDGITGSGRICTINFENKPFGPTKNVSKEPGDPRMGPTGVENKVFLIGAYEDGTAKLSWSEKNIGDGDNSGEVGVPDITPIAQDYLVTLTPGNLAAKPYLPIVDYDLDGEIGVPDITPIALRYLTNLSGYKVLKSTNGTNYTAVTSGITVTRAQAAQGMGITGDPTTSNGPLRYTWTDPEPPTVTTYYKVVPLGNDNLTTIESNVASVVPMKEYSQIRIEDITDPMPLITTEVSRLFPESAESFARPQVQLVASGIPAGSTDWEDATDAVVWYVLTNDSVVSVSSTGLVTGLNRGSAEIRAMSAFNYNVRDDILVTVATIDSIELTRNGTSDPISIARGTPLDFVATGTFTDGVDPDDGTPADETPPETFNITPYVGWLNVPNTANASVVFPFHSSGRMLTTDTALQAGDWVRVFCQFPGYVPTDPADPDNPDPKIMFGYVATSNNIQVTFE